MLKKNLSSVCRNEGSLLSTYNELKTCINWLGPTYSTDETVLAFSDLTSKTDARSDTGGTISTISEPHRSLITDAFDFMKNFFSHNIFVTGANGMKSLMSRYCFCIRANSVEV